MHKYQDYYEILIQAVQKAGEIMRNSFGREYIVGYKEEEAQRSIVTSVDKDCEDIIIKLITQAYPEHSICSEESSKILRNPDFEWIIDPIDGTLNFVHNIPLCACSVALRIGGQIVVGAVYNPFSAELFSAILGQGAWLNKQAIRVSKTAHFRDSCLILGLRHAPKDSPELTLQLINHCIKKHIPVRQLGAASLNMVWVAMGRADAYYQGTQLNLWDIAAAELILREAGGKLDNCPKSSGFLASNGHILPEFLQVLNNPIFS